ncbi:threonine aldolase family protein [Listeria floridensis]|uniref:threonine aldolase family protein n=1 Tax=Listeria floridensis TaxID=1494962 RepID=UPI00055D6EF9|nr:beta-eliminating lyase-related protein [Listeria floridensis]
MTNQDRLKQCFQKTQYKIGGNGARNVGVLQEALSKVDSLTESDMYGSGSLIEDFEAKFARLLGKEAAVFFPSGTMAQQIALRIWSDRANNRNVAYHPLAHLEIHEQDGLKKLHQMKTFLLGEEDRLLNLADIKALPEPVAAILIELPQREIGGKLPSFAELKEISAYCREKHIALHLDGARLFEVLPYYQKSAAEVAELFDSVYLSFYKGIGGIAGAILAGTADFCTEAEIWKRRYGGDLISLYPYILSADYYFEKRMPKMAQYFTKSRELAKRWNGTEKVTTQPEIPVSNMFHVYFEGASEAVSDILADLMDECDLGITGYLLEKDAGSCSFELSIGDATLEVDPKRMERFF